MLNVNKFLYKQSIFGIEISFNTPFDISKEYIILHIFEDIYPLFKMHSSYINDKKDFIWKNHLDNLKNQYWDEGHFYTLKLPFYYNADLPDEKPRLVYPSDDSFASNAELSFGIEKENTFYISLVIYSNIFSNDVNVNGSTLDIKAAAKVNRDNLNKLIINIIDELEGEIDHIYSSVYLPEELYMFGIRNDITRVIGVDIGLNTTSKLYKIKG